MKPIDHNGKAHSDESCWAEAFPLQVGQCSVPPGQPGGSVAVQYTAVNVIAEPPKDYIIWSLFSLVYSNPFCLGLVALIYSVKSRDRKVAGDLEGARSYGTSARFLNIVAIVLSATGFLMFIVIYCTLYYNINRHYY
ncbi:dispanin subfamily A member 2b-like [Seriola dumerili]|uniref:dispanin subfamily A member 2b-like n=1 Tax=Seriola dumerili TaxID=41447 RepID=UPI000BBE6CD1|nr:dispanin subfamily A member 2b-like [Seriola dumerili]